MENKIARKIDFGKIDYLGIGKKNCPVMVEVSLTKRGGEETSTIDKNEKKAPAGGRPVYFEFSASGAIKNHLGTGWYSGGQNLDEIAKYIKSPLFREIYSLWKKYHLNGMHAGTPEQEAALDNLEASGWRYDYSEACDYLKAKGLYAVPYHGLSTSRRWDGELYRYGSAWLVQEIPEEALERIKNIINGTTA